MIDVLIVDDSPTARYLLTELIHTTTDMRVVGEAENGNTAVIKAQELQPSIILMDLFMPDGDGITATQAIMAHTPRPIVIMSGGFKDEAQTSAATVEALRYGALAVLTKPRNIIERLNDAEVRSLIKTVRTLSSVGVIHHRQQAHPARATRPDINPKAFTGQPRVITIGVSTGGPSTLARLLADIPADFPVPIVIVQHISQPYLLSLVKWLSTQTRLKVTIAEPDQTPRAGHVYFAPIGQHLTINRQRRFALVDHPADIHTPSVNVLFNSVADTYGQNAIGILLTGMGIDGAQGLKHMVDQGAYTIAQDEASSIVYGMPREAALIGAAKHIAPIDAIVPLIIQLTDSRK